jgi:serine/threonine protein kinase
MTLDTKSMPQQIGNYDILSKIAEGGMGAVYKGRHRLDGSIVAIKVLPPTTAKNPVLVKRFEQEFRIAAALDHPNIVRAIEYNGTLPTPYLVMEFVEGESLGAKVDREGPMNEEIAIHVITQVCQGLHKAHKQKLVHRDVKPDNVLLTPDGVAKLTDLGLVKDADNETNLTKTGRGLGTPNFMAPEQFRDAKNADVRCDIYSLGATLYCMLTGEIPFGKVGPLDCWMRKIRNEVPPPRELNPNISERVDWAIRRSMSGDPEKRPASCKEFVEDLTGKSIRPPVNTPNMASEKDLWYLVYRDEDNETHTVKGSTDGIRKALKDGLLGDAANVRAARSKQGPFQPLTSHPEFRDLVIAPAPLETPAKTSSAILRSTPANNKIHTPPTTPRPDPEAVDYARSRTPDASAPTADYSYRPVPDSTPSMPRPHWKMGSGSEEDEEMAEPKHVDWMLWGIVLAVALGLVVVAILLLPRLKL